MFQNTRHKHKKSTASPLQLLAHLISFLCSSGAFFTSKEPDFPVIFQSGPDRYFSRLSEVFESFSSGLFPLIFQSNAGLFSKEYFLVCFVSQLELFWHKKASKLKG